MNEIKTGRMGYKQFINLLEGIRGQDINLTLLLTMNSNVCGKILLRVEGDKILLANITHLAAKPNLPLIAINFVNFIGFIRRRGHEGIFASDCMHHFFWKVEQAVDYSDFPKGHRINFEFYEKLMKPSDLIRRFKIDS